MSSDQDSTGQTSHLEGVSVKFDKNRPFATITLLITIGNNVVSQEFKDSESINWFGKLDCTGAETCTLKLYKKWNSKSPKLVACVDVPLQGLVVLEEPYIFEVKGSIKFRLTFSSSKRELGAASADDPSVGGDRKRPTKPECLSTAFSKAEHNVESAKLAAESQSTLLGLLGNARAAIELIASIGMSAGEIIPYGKAATTAIQTLAELCKRQEDCSKATEEIVQELESFLHIKRNALELKGRKETKEAVERMLELIAHISDFISEYATNRRFGNMISSEFKNKVEDFKQEFSRAKDSFDRSVNLDILKTIHELAQQFQLQRLRPVEALYKTGEGNVCLEGTRRSLLKRALFWLSQSPEQLFWLYGLAGSGKSSVANTIAMIIFQMNDVDLTCYFCKRDDPVLSKAERFIPTIAYLIARKHAGYRARLIDTLSRSDGIPLGDIQKQYDFLIGDLLPGVADPLRTHVIIVDALDECGLPDDQCKLATCMISLATTIPWVKVFVTSRPEPGIRNTLSGLCLATDINQEENTTIDIECFIRTRLESLKLTEFLDKVGELVQQAAGLFIWCATLFKYLARSRNPRRDMRDFLSGQTKEDPLLQLYRLYDQIIASAVDMEHPKDYEVLQAVLGIIYVCSGNRPLSTDAVAYFLRHDSRFVDEDFESVSSLTQTLHAVLYEEPNSFRTIRVYHPSFLDYLKWRLASKGGFVMDLSAVHELMANGCLAVMHKELKFNICCLENSYHFNSDILDLNERISKRISEALQYSSLFWFAHISNCDLRAGRNFIHSISTFVGSTEVLIWLEVLSFLEAINDGIAILRGCSMLFNDEYIASMTSDLERFVSAFAEAMESASHVYLSALAWLPEETLTYKTLGSTFTHLPMVVNKDRTWEGARWTRNIGSAVWSVGYDPKGHYYVAGNENGSIHVWDVRTTKQIHELCGHSGEVSSLVFSPNGLWLASGSWDCTIRFYSLATGETEKIFDNEVGVTTLVVSLDSTRIAAASRHGRVRAWEVESGTISFSQNANQSASISTWPSLRSIAFSFDSQRIVSGFDTIQIWDVRTGAQICELNHSECCHIGALVCSEDGKYIAASIQAGSNYVMRLWNAKTFDVIGDLHEEGVISSSFTTDSKEVYLGTENGSVSIWSIETLELIERIDLPLSAHIYDASFSPDLRSIVIGTQDTISIHDVSPMVARKAALGYTYEVAVSHDGCYIASCHKRNNCLYIWNNETGALATEPLQGHLDEVKSVALSNDGRNLVSGSRDKTIRIWDVSNWTSSEPLMGHAGAVHIVVVSPDDRHIASCSHDGTLRTWDMYTRSPVKVIDVDARSASFFPDGRRIAIASSYQGSSVFDALTGELIMRLSYDRADCVTVSPNGQWVASMIWGQLGLTLWDVNNGTEKKFDCLSRATAFTPDSQYLIERGISDSIRFSPNGKQIIVNCGDGKIRLCDGWDADYVLLEETPNNNTGGRIKRLQWGMACAGLEPTSGWIKDADGRLLLWVPAQYREDIAHSRKLVIPGEGQSIARPVIDYEKLLDCLENGWMKIYRPNM